MQCFRLPAFMMECSSELLRIHWAYQRLDKGQVRLKDILLRAVMLLRMYTPSTRNRKCNSGLTTLPMPIPKRHAKAEKKTETNPSPPHTLFFALKIHPPHQSTVGTTVKPVTIPTDSVIAFQPYFSITIPAAKGPTVLPRLHAALKRP